MTGQNGWGGGEASNQYNRVYRRKRGYSKVAHVRGEALSPITIIPNLDSTYQEPDLVFSTGNTQSKVLFIISILKYRKGKSSHKFP